MKFAAASLLLSVCTLAQAQGTKADYDRANHIRETLTNKTVDVPGPVTWLPAAGAIRLHRYRQGNHVRGFGLDVEMHARRLRLLEERSGARRRSRGTRGRFGGPDAGESGRSEEHTSELQSHSFISY